MRRTPTSPPPAPFPAGYSLLELLVTLAVASVVIGLGVPSFAGLIADKRLRAEADALFHAVYLARKASVARRRVVSICPSRDRTSCSEPSGWSSGWILFENVGRSATDTREPQEKIIKFHSVREGISIQANRRAFSFRSTDLRATNGTILICDDAGRTESRAVVISYTGRPRVARSDPRGHAYACAH